jgi:uncharacterized protein (TIGR03000 family)
MNRQSWKYFLIGAVMAVALSSTAPQADAHWWSYYQPVAWGGYGYGGYGYGCGYGGCYSACYTPSYSSCNSCWDNGSWYLGWRPGPIRRMFFGRYRWYYGNNCWGGYCATDVGCCTDGSVAAPATPAAPGTPTPAKKPVAEPAMPTEPAAVPEAPAPAEPAMPSDQVEPAMPKTSGTSAEDSGVLTVWVPYDAKVTVNGLETRSSGSRRQFVSFGLKPGFSYKYEVRAEVVRNGQVQEETRTITLTAGQVTAVAFGFNTPAQQVAAAH